jgi:hypothetical protein
MRILAIFSLTLLAGLTGCGSMTTAPPSELQYQEVNSVDLSSGEIFDKAQEWLALTFVDSKEVIETANRETGKIIGAGKVSISPTGIVSIPVRFTITIEAKEGRYRTTYTNYVAYYGTYRNQPTPVEDQRSAGQVNQRLAELDASLLKYLQDDDSDDW